MFQEPVIGILTNPTQLLLTSSGESACLYWLAGPVGLVDQASSGPDRQPGKALVFPTQLPSGVHGQEQCQGVQVITCRRETKANNPKNQRPREKVNGPQCCNGCSKYLKKDNRKMCLVILIYFQLLGFHTTEWFTNSNLISADMPSHTTSVFLPLHAFQSFFTVPSKRTTKYSTRDSPSLSNDYILCGFIKQGTRAKLLCNAEKKAGLCTNGSKLLTLQSQPSSLGKAQWRCSHP